MGQGKIWNRVMRDVIETLSKSRIEENLLIPFLILTFSLYCMLSKVCASTSIKMRSARTNGIWQQHHSLPTESWVDNVLCAWYCHTRRKYPQGKIILLHFFFWGGGGDKPFPILLFCISTYAKKMENTSWKTILNNREKAGLDECIWICANWLEKLPTLKAILSFKFLTCLCM